MTPSDGAVAFGCVTRVVQALVTEVRKEVKRLQEELEAAKVGRCSCSCLASFCFP
jgi:hypothetical protein